MKKIIGVFFLLILSACSAEADNSREMTKSDVEPATENKNAEETFTEAFQNTFIEIEPEVELNKSEQPTEQVAMDRESEAKEPMPTTPSKKAHYEQLLREIEVGLADLDDLYRTGVTSDLITAESEAHTRWDGALNEIYQALKEELSPESFEQLRNEQRQWMKTRDRKAEEALQEYHGGSAGGIAYASVLQMMTKERCYELLNHFP